MVETQIILREDTKLASVVKRSNGIEVGEKKVKVDDLLHSFMDMMEPHDLVELVLNNQEALTEGLAPFIEEQPAEKLNQVLQFFLDRARSDFDPELLGAFFRSITERFDVSEADPELLNNFFTQLLHRVQRVEDGNSYNELFLSLLKKISITEAEGKLVNQVLQDVVERADQEENVELVESMFLTLAKKAREKWVRQVLAPFIKKRKIVRSPILPKNCVVYQEELDGTEVFVIEVDKKQFDVMYHKTPFSNVGHPKLLFEFQVRLKTVVKCRVYAVKDAIVKPSSQLYRYPFSNIFDSFDACWPDLRSMPIKDLHQLSSLPYLFINSPSNDHAFRGSNLRELFATLEGVDFNDDLLEDAGFTVAERFDMK
jgi:hypothetical protein